MTTKLIVDNIAIEDIKEGMEASYSQTITDADVKTFAGMSGDHNPVHVNDEYAANSRWERRIAHGMISASFFSGLMGTKLPGIGCVWVSQTLKFLKPVYIGDTVTAKVIVRDIDLERRRVFLRTVCSVKGEIVIDGEAEAFVPRT
ncbi:enoyl-CoA hydratase [Arcobacter acticola]|uniref:Enoyl-CoA hydratase n=1 Tax=Arcobacter acticola TaxID=1849015 RepID=A0A6M8ESG6_9BACT|nr:MaoC family dehydratase [Arcobacter acticola]QKE27327.1 enoyl-CoA hydratase [Arcobacter acticola]